MGTGMEVVGQGWEYYTLASSIGMGVSPGGSMSVYTMGSRKDYRPLKAPPTRPTRFHALF